jgi:pilus assembly protein Flp/PilA
MRKILRMIVPNENGATAIEYGLIAALLAIGIITAVTGVKTKLIGTFNKVSTTLGAANTAN